LSARDAQTTFAPPPQVPYGLSISTENAKIVAAASIAEAQQNKLKDAIAIVDTGGYLVYFERMQDTHPDGKRRPRHRESSYGSPVPASNQSF
jgi:hypothetical protein